MVVTFNITRQGKDMVIDVECDHIPSLGEVIHVAGEKYTVEDMEKSIEFGKLKTKIFLWQP
jgi:hypothetical protein